MISELFLIPFLTGLGLAVLLPLLGCYLRLRDEWLAALAYSHVAAAGALLALVGGLPPALGGIAAAGLAGTGKRLFAAPAYWSGESRKLNLTQPAFAQQSPCSSTQNTPSQRIPPPPFSLRAYSVSNTSV